MQQKWILLCFTFASMLSKSFGQKQILFTKIQCEVKSDKIANVECFKEEENTSFTIKVTTKNNDISNFIGISDIHLCKYKFKKVMRLNGIRTDLCKVLTPSTRPNMQTLLYDGIKQTENNLPERCPFKKNTTYILRHMKFSGDYLPFYLPEYNFTYYGKFLADNVNIFEIRLKGAFCYINNDCTGST